jgi:superfamily II DNA helicase RecQ
MKSKDRKETQDKFFSGEIPIIVATSALGMGIDKKDIRLVVNHTIPKSIEENYQMIGRAGRDGKKSRTVSLFSPFDVQKIEFLIKKTNQNKPWEKTREELDRLKKMVEFCTKIQCRREMMLGHFGESHEGYCGDSGGCDVCKIDQVK